MNIHHRFIASFYELYSVLKVLIDYSQLIESSFLIEKIGNVFSTTNTMRLQLECSYSKTNTVRTLQDNKRPCASSSILHELTQHAKQS